KTEKALYKNFPLPGILRIISSCGNRFVTLQRPPPEIINLLPNLFPFSTKSVFAPNSAAEIAAINPAVPPPMTTTSYVITVTLSLFHVHLFMLAFYIVLYFTGRKNPRVYLASRICKHYAFKLFSNSSTNEPTYATAERIGCESDISTPACWLNCKGERVLPDFNTPSQSATASFLFSCIF